MAMIHISRSGTSLGSFPEEDVREGLRTGRFIGTDLGWREGMPTWKPLSEFTEFGAASPEAGPPPPVSVSPVVTPSPAGAALGVTAVRTGLPWEHRLERGFFYAYLETLQLVLSKPVEAFSLMKREGGLGDPLLYALIGGTFGAMVSFIYRFTLRSFQFGSFSRGDAMEHLFGSATLLFFLILSPVLVAIVTFIAAALFHVCLMIVGGAKQSFETTFRVVCFAGGSVNPLQIIPVCGGLIAGIWGLVLYCIGLARAHETDTGRAVLAVLLPLIVCCGGGLLLAVMVGALGAWGLSQH